ncbi:MAG: hypothetical protein ISP90_17330 [Nevskia sp.]|nr:hypothetical protein [Nevskia sp.]
MRIAPAARTPGNGRQRLLLAFALVPMLPAFYAALLFAQPWALPAGLLLGYAGALLPGLPLLLVLRRRSWLRWWHFALAGGLCALPAIALYRRVGTPPHLEAFSALNAAYLAAWGGFAGLCFWLLAVAGESLVSLRTLFGFEPRA